LKTAFLSALDREPIDAVNDAEILPGGGPGPHYHDREDEWFYIVEGRVSFFLNGTWTDLSPGDCIYSPRGSVHGFKNNTDQSIRVFINFTPAGIEGFFAEAAEEWAQPEPDMNRLTALNVSADCRAPTRTNCHRPARPAAGSSATAAVHTAELTSSAAAAKGPAESLRQVLAQSHRNLPAWRHR
jgi:hypothetical protein